jgi:TM2 domain-containing membrane protein YozV
MNCKNCGQPLVMGAKFCGNCGTPVSEPAGPSIDGISSPHLPHHEVPPEPVAAPYIPPQPAQPQQQWQAVPAPAPQPYVPPAPGSPFAGQVSNKDYLTTFLLAYFLGTFGIDRFYTNEIGLGLLKLFTGGGFGLWAFIDVILVLAGVRKDKWGRTLHGRDKNFKASLITFISVTALFVFAYVALIIWASNSSA